MEPKKCILALDGGGTRGYVSLLLLERLERDLGNVKIIDCFDLVCGTSTGGIIALGLQQGKTIAELILLYETLAASVFGGSVFSGVVNWGRYLINYGNSFYSAAPLENVLKKEFKNTRLQMEKNEKRVFVVAAAHSAASCSPHLFRNYANPRARRDETDLKELTPAPELVGTTNNLIWEAARATSAAPTYFPPAVVDKMTYVDGGVVANNPTEIAWHEASNLFGDDKIGLVLSIGTGIGNITEKKTSTLFTWANAMADMVTNTKTTDNSVRRWATKLNNLLGEKICYRRLDVPISNGDKLAIWKLKDITAWRQEVNNYLATPDAQIIFKTVVKRIKNIKNIKNNN